MAADRCCDRSAWQQPRTRPRQSATLKCRGASQTVRTSPTLPGVAEATITLPAPSVPSTLSFQGVHGCGGQGRDKNGQGRISLGSMVSLFLGQAMTGFGAGVGANNPSDPVEDLNRAAERSRVTTWHLPALSMYHAVDVCIPPPLSALSKAH